MKKSVLFYLSALLSLSQVPAHAEPQEPIAALTQGAALVLKVSSFDTARKNVLAITTAQNGTITEGHAQLVEKGRRHGFLRVSVPAQRFPALWEELRAAGIPSGERLTTTDRWAECVELSRRASRSEGHQKRLDSLLSSNIRKLRGSDILYIEERLGRAENDQDMLRLGREKIERAAQTVRLTIVLFEPYPQPTPRVMHPRRDLLLAWLPTAGLWTFWGGIGFLIFWLWRRWRR
jgi:hypothetical protein